MFIIVLRKGFYLLWQVRKQFFFYIYYNADLPYSRLKKVKQYQIKSLQVTYGTGVFGYVTTACL